MPAKASDGEWSPGHVTPASAPVNAKPKVAANGLRREIVIGALGGSLVAALAVVGIWVVVSRDDGRIAVAPAATVATSEPSNEIQDVLSVPLTEEAPPSEPEPALSPSNDELTGVWRAQLDSSGEDDSKQDMETKLERRRESDPDAILIWTNDWPGTYGPKSRNKWVVLSGRVWETTAPLLAWCEDEDLGCWAVRLEKSGDDYDANVDRGEPDEANN